MSDYALIIDYKYCTGCHSCEVACRKEKMIPSDQWGMKVVEHGPMIKDDGKCMWNFVPVPSDLCDLCQERIDAGSKPSCVQHCLASCMQAVSLGELGKVLAEKGDHVVCYLP